MKERYIVRVAAEIVDEVNSYEEAQTVVDELKQVHSIPDNEIDILKIEVLKESSYSDSLLLSL